jgi:hypothetical protein
VRGRRFALAAAVALGAAGALIPAGSGATGAMPRCKLAGIRYAGAPAGKAGVCFTLTANSKAMREFAVDPCAAADVALGTSRFQKRVPIRANGTFKATGSSLAAGGAGLGYVNLTLSGRIKGKVAAGSLKLESTDNGSTFTCSWTARRR